MNLRIIAIRDPGPAHLAELESAGIEIINALEHEPALIARHLAHAARSPMPARPTSRPLQRLAEPEPLGASDLAECPEPILCRCGAEAEPLAGKGQHAAQIRCAACSAHRWIGRAELARCGIDPMRLRPADPDSPQLSLGGMR